MPTKTDPEQSPLASRAIVASLAATAEDLKAELDSAESALFDAKLAELFRTLGELGLEIEAHGTEGARLLVRDIRLRKRRSFDALTPIAQ